MHSIRLFRSSFAAVLLSCLCFAEEGARKPVREYVPSLSADRYIGHVRYLASDELEGRRPGTEGIEKAAEYTSLQFSAAGLKPAGTDGWYQPFEVRRGKKIDDATASLTTAGTDFAWKLRESWIPCPFSGVQTVEGPLAFAGYGIQAEKHSWDDYKDFDPKDKVLLVFRYEPKDADPKADFGGETPSEFATFVRKANIAADKGALALLVVEPPLRDGADKDKLYAFSAAETNSSYRIPVISISLDAANALLKAGGMPDAATVQSKLDKDRTSLSKDLAGVSIKLNPGLKYTQARNVIGLLEGATAKDEYIVIGGHFDHLGNVGRGFGGGATEIHNGADDNASGTSGVLELARAMAAGPRPRRSILFMTYSAEEMGLLGSEHYVDNPTVPLENIKAMLNLDMIGKYGQREFTIYGVSTGKEFADLVKAAAEVAGVTKVSTPLRTDGLFGASDHASFHRKKIPVLFAFTGMHRQYHKPEDDWERIDADGAVTVIRMFHDIAQNVANLETGPTFTKYEPPAESEPKAEAASEPTARDRGGDSGSPDAARPRRPRVRLGIAPSYSDSGPGVLIESVLSDGAANKAGLKDGDRLLQINDRQIADMSGYMDALSGVTPGDEVSVVVQRGTEKLTLKIVTQAPPPRADAPKP
jgi:Peptidase family M28/PDZ domain/PA domain